MLYRYLFLLVLELCRIQNTSGCPPNTPVVKCFADPCSVSTCPRYPSARCEANYCGGCYADYYDGDKKVNCGEDITITGKIRCPGNSKALLRSSCVNVELTDDSIMDAPSTTLAFIQFDISGKKLDDGIAYNLSCSKPDRNKLSNSYDISVTINVGWCAVRSNGDYEWFREGDYLTESHNPVYFTSERNSYVKDIEIENCGSVEETTVPPFTTRNHLAVELSNEDITITGEIEFPAGSNELPQSSCMNVKLQDYSLQDVASFTLASQQFYIFGDLNGIRYSLTSKKPVQRELRRTFGVRVTVNVGWCATNGENGEWIRKGDYFTATRHTFKITSESNIYVKNVEVEKYGSVPTAAPSPLSSDSDGYVKGSDGLVYKFYDKHVDWFDAQATCQDEGAHLAIVDSSATFEYIKRNHNKYMRGMWLGARDEHSNNNWKWLNGKSVEGKHWERGEPNNYRGVQEDCMMTNYYNNPGRFHDAPCHWTGPRFLCQKDIPAGYSKGSDGMYYKFYDIDASWYDAKSRCISDGANLAIVDSDETHQHLRSVYRKRPYWIGINEIGKVGEWEYNDGRKLGRTYWDYGQPGSNGEDEDCVAIWTTGRWRDKNCYERHDFLCQIRGVASRTYNEVKKKEEKKFNGMILPLCIFAVVFVVLFLIVRVYVYHRYNKRRVSSPHAIVISAPPTEPAVPHMPPSDNETGEVKPPKYQDVYPIGGVIITDQRAMFDNQAYMHAPMDGLPPPPSYDAVVPPNYVIPAQVFAVSYGGNVVNQVHSNNVT